MRHPSIRGVGFRYALGLVLPVTGIALVAWVVVQLFIAQTAPRSQRPADAPHAASPGR